MSIERVFEDAAYAAALTIYLIETKADEADEEIAAILHDKPWLVNVIIGAMQAWSKPGEKICQSTDV